MSNYYPPLDPQTLRNLEVVRALAKEQPDYFKDSPYSPEIESLLGPSQGQGGASRKVTAETVDVLHELTETYNELMLHKPDNQDGAQVMGYFRTRTSLLEKLIELMGQGKNQKAISEFYAQVLTILEEVCTPTQVAQFSDRLKEFAK